MSLRIELGSRYGCWTVQAAGKKPAYYLCRCDCGNTKELRIYDLTKGKTKMCKACSTSVSKKSHGNTTRSAGASSEYMSYAHMIQRCTNPNSKDYPRYGGRGITVCDLWKDSFEAFLLMMGPKPTPDHTIERINTDGNYEPGNCRWATRTEQNRNKSDNVQVTLNGETKTMAEWIVALDLQPEKTIYKRIERGWDPVKALTTPISRKRDSHG